MLHISNVTLADDASFVVYTGSTDKDTSLFVHRFDDGTVAAGARHQRCSLAVPLAGWQVGRILPSRPDTEGFTRWRRCPDSVRGQRWPGSASGFPTVASSSRGRGSRGLFSVSAEGGKPTPLTTLDASKGEKGHWWPARLPDGRLLFTVFMAGAGLNDNRVAVFDPASGRHQSLFAGVKASWLASGHLLFYRAGRYQVVPFDLKTARTSGDAVVVLEDATELDPGR